MKMKCMVWILSVFLLGFAIFTGEAIVQQNALAEKTLRLHIVANSDSVTDQTNKLKLRDHILQEVNSMTYGCETLWDTESILMKRLPELEASAKAFLQSEGCYHDVKASLCEELFTTREYDTFSLPAGEYHTLRIVIGNGEGKNWWCVVFPTLCNASSLEELESAAVCGGYGEEEIALIRKEKTKYVLRFKLLEMIQSVFR